MFKSLLYDTAHLIFITKVVCFRVNSGVFALFIHRLLFVFIPTFIIIARQGLFVSIFFIQIHFVVLHSTINNKWHKLFEAFNEFSKMKTPVQCSGLNNRVKLPWFGRTTVSNRTEYKRITRNLKANRKK